MESKTGILFIFCVWFHMFVVCSAQNEPIKNYCNYDYEETYTSNSVFKKNIQAIPSLWNGSDASFYNLSMGSNPGDITNVIALCRGDVGVKSCKDCLGVAYNQLTTKCTREKESIIWKDKCMLRYSDRAIFKNMTTFPNAYAFSDKVLEAINAADFNKKVRSLLDKLQEKAASGTSVLKFATGNISVTENATTYGLTQCTPDLTAEQCKDCLDAAFSYLPSCCDGKMGGRELMPSCSFRYETGLPFYLGTGADISPLTDGSPSSLPGKGSDKRKTTITIIIVIVIVIVVLAILVCVGIYMYYFRKRKQRNLKEDSLVEMSTEESLSYDFDTVKSATEDFSDDNKLGQGGFGVVYKGRLPNGREIAVKRLSRGSTQGELEFKNEVLLLAKLQHRSLLRLLGYSIKATERLLIYEFIPNGSLDNFIFDRKKCSNLNADTRFKIVQGVARGLQYLHGDSRLRIIHRDLKPSNILLDVHMYPKIADFGTARLFEGEETGAATSRIVGTYGYMAPEYRISGQYSFKSDVFSFGVVVLEIATGQKNNFGRENKEYLPSYVWKKWRDGRMLDVIDSSLSNGDSTHDMLKCIQIALLCVQENVAERPDMHSILHMLNSTSMPLRTPSQPAFFNNTSSNSSLFIDQSINYEGPSTPNEVSITESTGR